MTQDHDIWAGLRPFPGRGERGRLSSARLANGITLIGIGKNEGPYILEWLAYHLAIGFDRIIIFDNESTDGMADIIGAACVNDSRIHYVPWRSFDGLSPQRSAYAAALLHLSTPWVAIADIDEFIVPFGADSINAWLAKVPAQIASLHINWRGFGCAGHEGPGYGLVTRAFTRCAPVDWGNQRHYKTIARTSLVNLIDIHDIETRSGDRVQSDFLPLKEREPGVAKRIVYSGIQINHYQCKTYPEFQARMQRGHANFPPGHPAKWRDDSRERFALLDRNEEEDHAIRKFDAVVDARLVRLRGLG